MASCQTLAGEIKILLPTAVENQDYYWKNAGFKYSRVDKYQINPGNKILACERAILRIN